MADETAGSASPGRRGRSIATASLLAVLVVAAGFVLVNGRADHSTALAVGSGTAWFWSPSTGAAVQVDGSTATTVARVPAQPAGEQRTIVQQHSGAIAVDQSRSTVERIDAATWTASSPVAVGQGADEQLQVVAGPGSLWAVTQGGSLVKPLDPVQLATLDSLTVPGPVTSAAVTDDDVLWTVNGVGEVRSFEDRAVRSQSRIEGLRDARIVVADDRAVVVDPATGAVVPLDEDGRPLDRICPDLGLSTGVELAGAADRPWVLAVDRASATVTIADLDAGRCRRFPVGAPGDDVGSPVERDGLVFVAHNGGAGEVVVVNPAKDDPPVRVALGLSTPDFVLFAHQGHVWFDAPKGDEMGVIRDDLSPTRINKADLTNDGGDGNTPDPDGTPDTTPGPDEPGPGPTTTVPRSTTTVFDPGPQGRTTVTTKATNNGGGGGGGGGNENNGGGGNPGGNGNGNGPPVFGVMASTTTDNRVDVSITTDGVTWSAPRPQGTGQITDAAYNGRQWILLGYDDRAGRANVKGVALISNDGYTWSQRDAGGNFLFGVTWSEEQAQWVAVGYNGSNQGVAATSPDGANWTQRPTGLTRSNLFDVTWSPQRALYVAVGVAGQTVGPADRRDSLATSPDGVTWTINQSLGGPILHAVGWSARQGQFVAVGSNGGNLVSYRSGDGVTWTSSTVVAGSGSMSGVGYSAERNGWVAVGSSNDQGVLAVSTDGSAWTVQEIQQIQFDVFASPVLYSPARQQWYALGAFGPLPGNPTLWTATREDGWTPNPVAMTGAALAFAG